MLAALESNSTHKHCTLFFKKKRLFSVQLSLGGVIFFSTPADNWLTTCQGIFSAVMVIDSRKIFSSVNIQSKKEAPFFAVRLIGTPLQNRQMYQSNSRLIFIMMCALQSDPTVGLIMQDASAKIHNKILLMSWRTLPAQINGQRVHMLFSCLSALLTGKITDNSTSTASPEEVETISSQSSRHSGGWRVDAVIIMDI